MYLKLPFEPGVQLQHLVLVLNTALLIAILVLIELLFAEAPAEKRRHIYYFLPLLSVVVGIGIYAVYQMGNT